MSLFSFHHYFGVVQFMSHPFFVLLPELAAGTCYNGSNNLHSLCSSKKKVPIFCRGGMSLPWSGWVVGSPSRLPFFRDGGSATPRTSHAHPTHKARLGGARPHAQCQRSHFPQARLSPTHIPRTSHARTSPHRGGQARRATEYTANPQ